jgi:hypothetical protein
MWICYDFCCHSFRVHVCAILGHVSQLEELLLQGADANALDGNGNTPLHLACERYAAGFVHDQFAPNFAVNDVIRSHQFSLK